MDIRAHIGNLKLPYDNQLNFHRSAEFIEYLVVSFSPQ